MDMHVVLHAISGYLFMSILLCFLLVAIVLIYNVWWHFKRDSCVSFQEHVPPEYTAPPVLCDECLKKTERKRKARDYDDIFGDDNVEPWP